MTNYEMVDAMIKRFGFEDERVIDFCRECEKREEDDPMLKIFFEATMAGFIG